MPIPEHDAILCSVSVYAPTYIALDASNWIDMERYKWRLCTKEIKAILNTGSILPYVTFEHFYEILRSDKRYGVFEILFSLKYVAHPEPCRFLRTSTKERICGSVDDIQYEEVLALLAQPDASWKTVVAKVRPKALGSVSSGQSLCNDPVIKSMVESGSPPRHATINDWAESMEFVTEANGRILFPPAGSYTLAAGREAEERRRALKGRVAEFLQTKGAPGLRDVDETLELLYRQASHLIGPFCQCGGNDPILMLLTALGIKPERLRTTKAGYRELPLEELLFASRKIVFEKGLGLKEGLLYAIDWDRVPTWRIEGELGSATRRGESTGRAKGSNCIDHKLSGLALYVDRVQVDRRVFHYFEVAAKKDGCLRELQRRLRRTSTLDVLAEDLRHFTNE
ncbi:hypothetical protein [Methylacidimicrobium tartarophylax]|uniref:PIN domain-containing protein n=1 Tax=Methylacidimicrobium tartarophylax TaxID=1041768 RepID=A0A5E6MEB0_9BACT|nr:hypothetical protein [Methylacidimicrobium tartarophylax]VVM07544.1 hypothetical protein MAMT_01797 [Methylacidimicrobium tartarophylax]